ncbi:GNAT family N-acetyltransferase [Streptomyces olivaceus]|uniref:GNAT family N-acetyltransferase n=1 Tax=Streptomyces olivaceus TaxID=47716 RepID=UPI001CCCE628|nr:GNAT family N-acetyltransferase [Streptomyces olivaceus]MBZ6130009.1 GNAT family N-acetyltransferase [Streptomyces olivaceus]
MDETVRVRPLADRDWDAVVALERDAYSGLGLSEDRAALQSRAAASPDTCFVVDVGPRTAGYVLALPYPPHRYPDLARTEDAEPPARPSGPTSGSGGWGNLHLHDIVVAPGLRRCGLARHLLHHLTGTARARGDERISLVAVGGTEGFWTARGFVAQPGVVPAGAYGGGAVYMSKPVPARPSPPATTLREVS